MSCLNGWSSLSCHVEVTSTNPQCESLTKIAMSWKMLHGAEHVLAMVLVDDAAGMSHDESTVGAKTAVEWPIGEAAIAVDVEHRRQVQADAAGGQICHHAAGIVTSGVKVVDLP